MPSTNEAGEVNVLHHNEPPGGRMKDSEASSGQEYSASMLMFIPVS